jgi:hypothetical protein
MEAAEAISLVTQYILWRDLNYPTDGLQAERFEAGWCVYAPVEDDGSDPTVFQDASMRRSVFLVGESERIKEVSSSIPLRAARAEFAAQELAAEETDRASDELESPVEFEPQIRQDGLENGSTIGNFTDVDVPREGGDTQT